MVANNVNSLILDSQYIAQTIKKISLYKKSLILIFKKQACYDAHITMTNVISGEPG